MKRSDLIWTLIGLSAVVLSCFLLYHEVRTISLDEIADSLNAISTRHWLLAAGATLGAYCALAWYDRIAIAHLGKKIPWHFITLCSFTTYALAHNIGASVFSGALVRYRAYRTKGLSPQEIGILIVFCSFTFALGTLLATGCVLILQPSIMQRVLDVPTALAMGIGVLLLLLVGLYVLGSWLQLKPWRLGKVHIEYPRLGIVARQLLAGPLELACAAAIIYFALPAEHNPGYLIVLGVFLASFSLALLSHAPGGLGVLEVSFLAALPDVPTSGVLAALIVFRGFYLLLPFALSLLVVLGFEWGQWRIRREERQTLP
ncbi:MAG: flippase-like domain-containing protein [Gammaproteobacteria bacterium]|nr:flippase-like domain-containing protein [Gammaproteobacteria bacterium]MBU1489712.1 flippase-like domain-containing protein [Gammaproteobacteria bacterium]MBU2065094.1 flippase-like domain-containing protein [Gammaproteobacteria bacterium]MBU2137566.1 flippase-like domain-containing protein [Gammaproteobacteria bacterium]MBU2216446.1 flippase-like domain-containing protein [Gammaproteobacteria bacterium]